MSNTPTAAVIGGTAGVGRALADRLAATGYRVVVTGRDRRDLDAVAADLTARHDADVRGLVLELDSSPEELDHALTTIEQTLGAIDAVLFAAGANHDDDDGVDGARSQRLLQVNYAAIAHLAGATLQRMEARGSGTIVFFSSIAAHAPRDRNVAYAAAKSALESFARSLQHRLADSTIGVQLYTLGYVDTALAHEQELKAPPMRPEAVAARVVDALGTGHRRRFLPGYWRPITFVLGRLPWPVYKRLRF